MLISNRSALSDPRLFNFERPRDFAQQHPELRAYMPTWYEIEKKPGESTVLLNNPGAIRLWPIKCFPWRQRLHLYFCQKSAHNSPHARLGQRIVCTCRQCLRSRYDAWGNRESGHLRTGNRVDIKHRKPRTRSETLSWISFFLKKEKKKRLCLTSTCLTVHHEHVFGSICIS